MYNIEIGILKSVKVIINTKGKKERKVNLKWKLKWLPLYFHYFESESSLQPNLQELCSKLLKFFQSLLDSSRPFSFGKWTNIWYWNVIHERGKMWSVDGTDTFAFLILPQPLEASSINRIGRPNGKTLVNDYSADNRFRQQYPIRVSISKVFRHRSIEKLKFPHNNVFPPFPRVSFFFFS